MKKSLSRAHKNQETRKMMKSRLKFEEYSISFPFHASMTTKFQKGFFFVFDLASNHPSFKEPENRGEKSLSRGRFQKIAISQFTLNYWTIHLQKPNPNRQLIWLICLKSEIRFQVTRPLLVSIEIFVCSRKHSSQRNQWFRYVVHTRGLRSTKSCNATVEINQCQRFRCFYIHQERKRDS